MPGVPGEFFQSVMPEAGQPGGRPELGIENNIDKATPADFGGQVGTALDQMGDQLAQHAIKRQELINEAATNDTFANKFAPQMDTIYQNYLKLEGKDAEDQFPAYQQQMNQVRQQFRDSLPNPMQQQSFDKMSMSRVESDLAGMSRYGAQQTKDWQLNTHNAVIDNLATDGAAHFNDPGRLQANQDEIDRQTVNYGATHGWSEDQTKSEMGKNQAKLWAAVIERQAVYNPLQAQQILDAKTKDGTLPGDAQVKLQEKLKPQMEMLQSQSAYGNVTGGATAQQIGLKAQQQGIDPNLALTVWSAEGAVTNPATKNPVSSATGHFQIIDSTWKDLGGTDQDRFDSGRQVDLGLQNIKQATQALTKDLGQQPQPWQVYLAHQQGIAGATALLHSDPNASAAGVVGNPDAITNNMPGATKDTTVAQFNNFIQGYVQKHAQMYDPGGAPSAQNLADNYEQHLNELADQARKDFPNDPSAVDRYQAHYIQQAGRIIAAQKMTDDANRKVINNALSGPQAFQSKDEFLADPATKAAYDAIYEKDHGIADTVDNFYVKKSLGLYNPAPTPESDNLYGSLKGYARSDQKEQFASMDLHPYYGAMPESQYNELVTQQQHILDRDAAESGKSIKINTAVNNVQDLLNRAKNRDYKDQTPYFGLDKNGYGRTQDMFFRFQHDYENDLDAFEQNNNRPPTYKEQRDLATQRLFPNGLTEAQPKQKPGATAAPAQSASAPGQTASPQIDFSKFKPENQDAFSQAVATELLASGKLVNDDSIAKAKAIAITLHPGIEQQFANQKPQKTGD
jgi:hypothetical protein